MSTVAIPDPQTSGAAPTSYQAAVVHEFGGPLTVEQVPMQKLAPG